ncbi:MAG: hypothetical protein MJZ63_00580 [Muribaculaceae bacterium]|nr:hypothetical protein [Muribaculaceae bacterium]
MKKSLLFAAMLMACASVNAQDVVTVGSLEDASTTNKYPLYSFYECSSSEIVYTAEDLASLPVGQLSKLEFAVTGGQTLYTHLTVWLENTTDDEVLAAGSDKSLYPVDQMSKVYESTNKGYYNDERTLNKFDGATVDNPGYMDFEFDTPFEYTGGGLRVRFESISGSYCNSEFKFVVDNVKANESEKKNCSSAYDFSESGMRTRNAVAERSFPVVRFTVTQPQPTSVNDVAVKDVKEVSYYNVYGQKVAADTKGVVISSEGKKFINR